MTLFLIDPARDGYLWPYEKDLYIRLPRELTYGPSETFRLHPDDTAGIVLASSASTRRLRKLERDRQVAAEAAQRAQQEAPHFQGAQQETAGPSITSADLAEWQTRMFAHMETHTQEMRALGERMESVSLHCGTVGQRVMNFHQEFVDNRGEMRQRVGAIEHDVHETRQELRDFRAESQSQFTDDGEW
ncbi:hypothetical protein V2J09_020817 [Rumex salicifolius]